MKKKTYGIYGIIEYEMSVNAAGQSMRVNFHDGSITQNGIVPATYTTENPVVQVLIEQSKAYKNGRIKVIKAEEVEAPAAANSGQRTGDSEQGTANSEQETADCGQGTVDSEQETGKEAKVAKVVVHCQEDAVEVLRGYGCKPSRLLTKEAIDKAAKTNGIEFVYVED